MYSVKYCKLINGEEFIAEADTTTATAETIFRNAVTIQLSASSITETAELFPWPLYSAEDKLTIIKNDHIMILKEPRTSVAAAYRDAYGLNSSASIATPTKQKIYTGE